MTNIVVLYYCLYVNHGRTLEVEGEGIPSFDPQSLHLSEGVLLSRPTIVMVLLFGLL